MAKGNKVNQEETKLDALTRLENEFDTNPLNVKEEIDTMNKLLEPAFNTQETQKAADTAANLTTTSNITQYESNNNLVSEYIENKYGNKIMLGSNGNCPFCCHKTFSIKKDNTFGKCWHPQCGKYISLNSITGNNNYQQIILQKIFDDFHKELLRLKEVTHYKTAYDYLIDRKIHPQVIAGSMLGVISGNYQQTIVEMVDFYINKINEDIIKLKNKMAEFENQEGSKNKKDLEYRINTLIKKRNEELEPLKNEFINFLSKNAGNLVFFFTDKYHRITKIRIRTPYTKFFTIFIFNKKAKGTFNHQLFPFNNQDKVKNPILDKHIVLEGEFNQLQLQSLMIRNKQTYVNSCSIGSVNDADLKRIIKRLVHLL